MAEEQQHTPEQLREFELQDLRNQAQFYADTEVFLAGRVFEIHSDARSFVVPEREAARDIAPMALAACACSAEARALRAEIAALEAGGGTDG